jgi:hypothetical protein
MGKQCSRLLDDLSRRIEIAKLAPGDVVYLPLGQVRGYYMVHAGSSCGWGDNYIQHASNCEEPRIAMEALRDVPWTKVGR